MNENPKTDRPDYRCTCARLRCTHEPYKCEGRSRGNAGWECRECHELPPAPDPWASSHKEPA